MRDPRTHSLALAHCEAAAQVIRQHLIDRGAYGNQAKNMTGPVALAYFVGWSEGALRSAGFAPESEDGLDALGNMLWVIFDESLLPGVSNGAIATAYFDFRRAILRRDAAVQDAYRAGFQDFARYNEKGAPPARLGGVFRPRREPLRARRLERA